LLFDNLKYKAAIALSAAFVVIAIAAPGSASAKCVTGGLTPAAIDVCTPTAKAKLLPTGELIPPKSAPPRIVAVIEAANKIRTKPYIYGGGHGRWWDKGYDCSGSVSFALHGGEFLTSPAAKPARAGTSTCATTSATSPATRPATSSLAPPGPTATASVLHLG
jgi:hypothetical protein